MSPTRPSKRRRIDNATHTLSQPFKSPFKTPLKAKHPTETNIPPSSSSPTKEDPTAAKDPPTSPPPATHPLPTTTPLKRTLPTTHTPPSSEYSTLQKRHTHLLNALSAARANLETSKQALKIETSNRKADLEALIQKWKIASRAAAEEVFSKARDRVNKMGGVGAMKDREKESREKTWGWDDEPRREGGDGVGGEEDPGGEQDEREEGAKRGEEEVGDEEGYTMDMMLKALNVELDVIGYDKGMQKWVD